MRRMSSNAGSNRARRIRPILEDLEGRRLLSGGAPRPARLSPAAISSGEFSQNDRKFTYRTPTGGEARVRIVGIGTLTGTTVDSRGALHLVYGGTNAYSKIVGD